MIKMDKEMIYYWENKMDEIEVNEPSINDYILHFALINQHNNSGINKWICCEDINKLLGFIKYVALPSSQITRILIDKDKKEEVCVDVIGYDESLEVFEDIDSKTKFIEEYKGWFFQIEKYDKETNIEEIKATLDTITQDVDYRNGVILTLQLYKNIKEVGFKLIKDYEEEGLVDILEDCFNFSKEEIENLFNNLDENKFLLKRVIPILDNLDMI